MIRQLAAAHESGSPFGSSNSVNHFTSVRRSPMVLKRCSKGNVPTAVVSRRLATYSVAPFSRPRQLNVPLRPFASMLALHSKPGSGVSATFAALTCALDSQVARSARAVCAQHVGCVIVTSGALDDAREDHETGLRRALRTCVPHRGDNPRIPMDDLRPITPIRRPLVDKRARVPASKSVANREIVLSAIANGRSRLDRGPLDPGDDVQAMTDALVAST